MKRTRRFIKDADTNTKIKALAEYLGIPEEEISESWDEDNFETEGDGDWIVTDYDTAYSLAIEYVKEIYDEMGLESFTEGFRDYILGNYLDDKALQDTMYEDIKERYNYEDDDEILDEAEYFDLIDDKDEFEGDIEELREKIIDKYYEIYENRPYDYFEEIYGKGKDLNDFLADYIDIDEVARQAVMEKGIAHFIASYDGNEVDLGNDLYGYRTN